MTHESFCCDDMQVHVTHRCNDPKCQGLCPETIIVRTRLGLYGIPIHDGGSSFIQMFFCPWCATNLRPEATK